MALSRKGKTRSEFCAFRVYKRRRCAVTPKRWKEYACKLTNRAAWCRNIIHRMQMEGDWPSVQNVLSRWDIHVYFDPNDPEDVKSVTELQEELKNAFPELPCYPLVHEAVGPHPQAMFESHMFTAEQVRPTLLAIFFSSVYSRDPLPHFDPAVAYSSRASSRGSVSITSTIQFSSIHFTKTRWKMAWIILSIRSGSASSYRLRRRFLLTAICRFKLYWTWTYQQILCLML